MLIHRFSDTVSRSWWNAFDSSRRLSRTKKRAKPRYYSVTLLCGFAFDLPRYIIQSRTHLTLLLEKKRNENIFNWRPPPPPPVDYRLGASRISVLLRRAVTKFTERQELGNYIRCRRNSFFFLFTFIFAITLLVISRTDFAGVATLPSDEMRRSTIPRGALFYCFSLANKRTKSQNKYFYLDCMYCITRMRTWSRWTSVRHQFNGTQLELELIYSALTHRNSHSWKLLVMPLLDAVLPYKFTDLDKKKRQCFFCFFAFMEDIWFLLERFLFSLFDLFRKPIK